MPYHQLCYYAYFYPIILKYIFGEVAYNYFIVIIAITFKNYFAPTCRSPHAMHGGGIISVCRITMLTICPISFIPP
jgi:hypothetical protein